VVYIHLYTCRLIHDLDSAISGGGGGGGGRGGGKEETKMNVIDVIIVESFVLLRSARIAGSLL
jgi:hypothetical protein